MFRRKEDSLFDTATDTATTGSESTGNSGSSGATGTSGSATSGNASSSASAPSLGATAATAAPASSSPAPRSETRPASQPTTGFRAGASPLGGELGRNRMPEAKTSAAASALNADKKAGRRVLTVGNDILLKGEIATCDRLVIEGKVDATLNEVHTVEIAENGSFKGSAQIEDAEISGLFEGELVVRNRLVIYATGKVRGKISYGEIEIERGGELTGEIKTTSGQGSAARPASTRPAGAKEDKNAFAA